MRTYRGVSIIRVRKEERERNREKQTHIYRELERERLNDWVS